MIIKQKHIVTKVSVLPILYMSLLFGCASARISQETMPANVNLANYERLTIEVSSKTPEASNKETSQLRELLTNKIQERNLFKQSVGRNSADLLLKAEIVDLKRVNPVERVVIGIFASKGKAVADVQLVDLKTAKPISTFRVEGESLGDTEVTFDYLAEKIVGFIQENYQKSGVKKTATELKQIPEEQETKPEKTTERLQQLKELYDRGLITEQEYQEKRSEILQGL